jgi:PAS domain S-box-containing protein
MGKLFDAFFRGSSDAIVIADADSGVVQEVNEKACDLFGYSDEELRGKHVTELHPLEELEKISQRFHEMVNSPHKEETETLIIRRDGKKIPVLITSANTFSLGDKRFGVGFFKDLRPEKNLERIAWEQSHIVRSPVATILGCLYVMDIHPDDPDIHKQMLEGIRESAQKLDEIIRDTVKITEWEKEIDVRNALG